MRMFNLFLISFLLIGVVGAVDFRYTNDLVPDKYLSRGLTDGGNLTLSLIDDYFLRNYGDVSTGNYTFEQISVNKLFANFSNFVYTNITVINSSLLNMSGDIYMNNNSIFDVYNLSVYGVSSFYGDVTIYDGATLTADYLSNNGVSIVANKVVRLARVDEAGGITKGQVVYETGATGDKPTVALAYNNLHFPAHSLGVASTSGVNGELILVQTQGELDNVNTSGFVEGCILHLSNTAGELSCSHEENGAHIHIGTATKINANTGIIEVDVKDYVHDIRGVPDVNVVLALGGTNANNTISFEEYNHTTIGWVNGLREFFFGSENNDTTQNSTFTISSSVDKDLLLVQDSGLGDSSPFVVDSSGNVCVGNVTCSKKLFVNGDGEFRDATEQLRLSYDSSNYVSNRVANDGALTMNGIGTDADWIFQHNSVQKMKYDAGLGFFGFGTNPSRFIHAYSGTADTVMRLESSDSVATLEMKDSGGTATIQCNNGNFVMKSALGPPQGDLIIDNDQLGRIGTRTITGPQGRIHAKSQANDEPTLVLEQYTTSQSADLLKFINGGTLSVFDGNASLCLNCSDPSGVLEVNGYSRLGGSSTNYVEVESDADINFFGGAGLQFGEIYGYDQNDTITISGTGIANKVQITSFDSNGEFNGNITPDNTNDHIIIGKTGKYFVTASIVAESSGGNSISVGFNVYVNNGTTQFQNLHAHRFLSGGAGDTGSVSINGFASFSADDTVELWLWNDVNTDNVIIDDIDLLVMQVGG